ncbi:MAG: hypothetical protein D6744_13585 [Planctomycetota bacterium]|nr:MAG: hypothetical protein D6744_13585 [Planctomycetota bacterium]
MADKRTIQLDWLTPKGKEFARGSLFLQGFRDGEAVEIEIWEIDKHGEYRKHKSEQIGAIAGTVKTPIKGLPRQVLTSTTAKGASSTMSPPMTGLPQIIFEVDQLGSKAEYDFTPVSVHGEADEGDSWEVQAILKGDKAVRSRVYYVARLDHRVPTSQATYRWHEGHKLSFYNDGSTDASGSGGYFHDLNKAIDEAQHFIFIADWSFHPFMKLSPTAAETVGEKLSKWAKSHPDGLVAIHTWDHTNIGAADSQNDNAEKHLKSIGKPANLLWRASSRTGQGGGSGFGWSHHQKFVVLDCPAEGDKQNRRGIRAFLGGLDLTKGRFDWPQHAILDSQAGAADLLKVTNTANEVHEWYNAEFGDAPLNSGKTQVDASSTKFFPRQPWHDIHCQVAGPSAWDVVREFVGRWELDPATPDAMGDDKDAHIKQVRDLFVKRLFDKKKFKPQWEPHPGDWTAQVLRSITKDHWGSKTTVVTPAQHKKNKTEFTWRIRNKKFERSIQDSYLRSIEQAERFIYIETQYFIGSGTKWLSTSTRKGVRNKIPETLAARILEKHIKGEDFHVYLIIPYFPEGDPASSAAQAQRDFEWSSIELIIRTLKTAGVSDWRKYFTVGFLANWLGVSSLAAKGSRAEKCRKNKRYMVYVHSKFMLIDDRFMIIGSANLNERSLAGGRDSEIAVGLWPNITKQDACAAQARAFRQRLFTEHFGSPPSGWEGPESAACVKAVQQIGRDNYALFAAGKTSDGGKSKKGHFCMWPIDGDKNGLGLRDQEDLGGVKKAGVIVDGDTGPIIGDDWYIWPTSYTGMGDIAE